MYLLDLNSAVVDSGKNWFGDDRFVFKVPREGGRYILSIEKEGLKPYRDTLTVKCFRNSESFRELPPILLSPEIKTRELGSAEVKATKIKFYQKGDTVVYNADAFKTADGSMLDALIRQLPGVELKSDGRILVNGKQVESLLLNGEKFFDDKRELVLENLPSYAVKNIKVYDRKERFSEIMHRDSEGKEYVMDVWLKHEYMESWLANIEAGLGTSDRYMARLFAMRFTPNSRLAVVANANNVNDKRRPGEDTEWTPDQMPTGLLSTKMAGVDYLVKEQLDKWRVSGNATVEHTDGDDYSEVSGETFLNTGNWFSRSRNSNKSRRFSFDTQNTASFLFKDDVTFEVWPSMSYSNYNNSASSVSATLNGNPDNIYKEGILDSIAMRGGSELLRTMALNRTINDSKSSGNDMSVNLPMMFNCYALGGQMGLSTSFNYATSRNRSFTERLIDYPTDHSKPADYQNLYIHDKPNRRLQYSANLRWNYSEIKHMAFDVMYEFSQSHSKHDYEHNVLSRMEDWNFEHAAEHPLGTLPSETDYALRTLDGQNSYNQSEQSTIHGPSFTVSYSGAIPIFLNFAVRFKHQRLDYYRGNHYDCTFYDGVTRKNDVLLMPRLHVQKDFKVKDYDITTSLGYSASQSSPNMTSYIEVEDNSNPLNIYTGNSGLKKSTTHDVNLRIASRKDKGWGFELMPDYMAECNALAYGYTYNAATGVRHYRPENVNGNYTLSLQTVAYGDIDSKKRLSLYNQAWGSYIHGVDLMGEDGAASSMRSTVGTWRTTERLTLNYKLGKHSVGAKGQLTVNRSTSSQLNFTSVTVCDFNYGMTAQLELPFNMQLSTDLTMFSRRGYTTREANTNDLVWNARLSKRIPKANLTFVLDGFDILGNLSNTTHSLNSQGRTEVYCNALPRYVMAHLIYRLTKSPKQ